MCVVLNNRTQKGERMEKKIKLTIEAIRMQMDVSRAEMAAMLNINNDRYNRLANGESKMLATEFVALHEISGIPFENISPST